MNELRTDGGGDPPKVRRLAEAVRRVRIAEAERIDAFSDLYDAEKARLEMLAEDLALVFADLPENDEYFICQVSAGSPPRLWVDPTSHVTIGRDRRTYRFLKDTRLGRVVIMETTDLLAVADAVTHYIAERLVERERAQETDHLVARLRSVSAAAPLAPERPEPPRAETAAAPSPAPAPPGRSGAGRLFLTFLLGALAGAAGLIAYAWFKVPL